MIFCGRCGQAKGLPMSSIRTSRAACEICGGHDQIQVKSRSGTSLRDLPNYSYPSNLLVTEQPEADRA